MKLFMLFKIDGVFNNYYYVKALWFSDATNYELNNIADQLNNSIIQLNESIVVVMSTR